MNQIRPLRMIPRQAAPGRLGLHIRPIQDQPHPVQNDINERCQPKFWQIFFILQTIFTVISVYDLILMRFLIDEALP